MAEKTRDKAAVSEAHLEARRAALGKKISQKITEAKQIPPSALQEEQKAHNQSALALGFRLSADFLSAVLIGGALGLGLDRLTGIAPWGTAVFLLLGFAAGVVNILRSLGRRVTYGGGR